MKTSLKISQSIDSHIDSCPFWFWFGRDGISIWDKRKEKVFYIAYIEKTLPCLPGFSDIWERFADYQEEIRKIIGRFIIKPRLALIVPEDISRIEKRALEDFCIVAARGRELFEFTQSMILHSPLEDYIALTLTCRTCCIALVREGEIEKREFFAVHDCTRESIKENLQRFCQKYQGETLQVCYPQIEESELLFGQGTGVSFEEMMKNYLCFIRERRKKFL